MKPKANGYMKANVSVRCSILLKRHAGVVPAAGISAALAEVTHLQHVSIGPRTRPRVLRLGQRHHRINIGEQTTCTQFHN
jgi:hypothetical protein